MPLTRSIDVDQGVGAKRRCWVRRILSGRLVPNLRVPRSGPLGRRARSGTRLGLVVAAAHRLSRELQAVCPVEQAVEDGVGERRLADGVVPGLHGKLADHNRRPVGCNLSAGAISARRGRINGAIPRIAESEMGRRRGFRLALPGGGWTSACRLDAFDEHQGGRSRFTRRFPQ